MRFTFSTFLVAISITLGLAGNTKVLAEPVLEELGQRIGPIQLRDVDGKNVAIGDLESKKVFVIVFLSFDCPICISYFAPLSEINDRYRARGVELVGVVTGEDLKPVEVRKLALEYKLKFRLCIDSDRAAVKAFQAKVTPEAFVLGKEQVLRYRGRIDNAYAARLKKNNQVTRHELREALDALLADKAISPATTAAIGCPIKQDKMIAPESSQVTFYRDVLPILQNNCQSCHRPGEVGPFSLMTYRQASKWAADIKEYTQSRKMPPWKPVAGPAFMNERKLSTRDLAVLAQWADGGTAEGNPKDAPPPRHFIEGWQLGQPDLVLKVPSEFLLGPNGKDVFRCFVLPANTFEDRQVTAVEVRPGNPRIVHHVLLYLDTSGRARQLENEEHSGTEAKKEFDKGPGYSRSMGVGFVPRGGLGGWAPGQMARHLPEGTCYYLPGGADVVLQVHYHRNGRPEKDSTSVGLYFAKKPTPKRLQSLVVAGGKGRFRFFAIPPGAKEYRFQGSLWVEQDCDIYSVMPHMHLLGRQIKVTMTPPGGTPEPLVAIENWDYNWQETYSFKTPIPIKAGTRFDIEAVYDNSAQNPNNPSSPPRFVTFGEQTTNEMLFGFIGAAADQPGKIRQRFTEQPRANKPKSTTTKKS